MIKRPFKFHFPGGYIYYDIVATAEISDDHQKTLHAYCIRPKKYFFNRWVYRETKISAFFAAVIRLHPSLVKLFKIEGW